MACCRPEIEEFATVLFGARFGDRGASASSSPFSENAAPPACIILNCFCCSCQRRLCMAVIRVEEVLDDMDSADILEVAE